MWLWFGVMPDCARWVGCIWLMCPTAYLLFFVLPQRKVTKESGHFCELLRTQKEPGCALLWLARPLFASSASASCLAAVVLKFEVMPDENENLIGYGDGVRGCFSCGCGLGLCPIVPDGWEGGERTSGERLGGVV